IFNIPSEDCLEDLVSNKQSGNPTFSLHKEIASPEVIHEINYSKGCNFISEELLDIDSFNDIHPYFDDDPLSGSTIFSSNSLLEEFADELALITYPPDYDDNRTYDVESDIREIEFLLFQGEDSDFKDSIDQSDLTNRDDLFVDPTPEMFTDEQPPDYSFPPRFDVYPDDFLEIESDANNFDDDLFDSEGEKIKESELLIDQLDLPYDILSENGAHVGYNFPAQVPSIQTLPSFPQQYPCFEDCEGLPEADHCQPLQYTVNHTIFNAHNDLLNSQNKLMEQLTSMCDMLPVCYDDDKDEERSISLKDNIISGLPPCASITPISSTEKPVDSLIMGDEHLDTIPATESDEFIKSSVENLFPIPSESKGEHECDMPVCEEFTTFSNILFVSDYDFYSSANQSFFDEDLPKEIYLNPLFDEEIIHMKIDQHHYNAESDLIESLRTHDSSIIISSKIDSLFDEFADKLTLLKSIPPRIDETDYYPEEETHFIKRLLYDNSSPRPPEEFVSDNSDTEIESFSSFPILVEDCDSLMEEIDLSFTPDYPMPPGIEDDDYESERDILILKDLHSNDTLLLPDNESFHFDIPSFSRPPAKPPDGNTGILNVKMMGDISEQKGLKAFQSSAECPMMIHGRNTPILDVPLFHFCPP
nr:hypothetical protein [Tanacetum cinerariifolium]